MSEKISNAVSTSPKFVPTMMNISDCAKKLPNAATTRDMVLEVEVGGKPGVKVAFERIKYLGKSGVSEARWSYKGRVLV